MRHFIGFILIIILLLSAAGCKNIKDIIYETEVTSGQSDTTEAETTGALECQPWIEIVAPELDHLESLTVVGYDCGVVAAADSTSQDYINVYILRGYNSSYYEFYMVVDNDIDVKYMNLATEHYLSSLGASLYLRDVDGDGLDEIIVQQMVDLFGGFGQHLSRIFKVVNGEITEFFNSIYPDKFDTGFLNTFQDGYIVEINNKFTGNKTTLDFSADKGYEGWFFDENGAFIEGYDILIDSFFEFEPNDIDGDDIYEIICKQYVTLNCHADYIGTAKSILKYNQETNYFEVIESEFITPNNP